MIKLADRSELGWSVVEEHKADELADNSEEIVRAEKEAERKALKRKKRRMDEQSTEE